VVTQELLDYINQALKTGKNQNEIILGLVTQGWESEDIQDAFQQLGYQTESATQPLQPSKLGFNSTNLQKQLHLGTKKNLVGFLQIFKPTRKKFIVAFCVTFFVELTQYLFYRYLGLIQISDPIIKDYYLIYLTLPSSLHTIIFYLPQSFLNLLLFPLTEYTIRTGNHLSADFLNFIDQIIAYIEDFFLLYIITQFIIFFIKSSKKSIRAAVSFIVLTILLEFFYLRIVTLIFDHPPAGIIPAIIVSIPFDALILIYITGLFDFGRKHRKLAAACVVLGLLISVVAVPILATNLNKRDKANEIVKYFTSASNSPYKLLPGNYSVKTYSVHTMSSRSDGYSDIDLFTSTKSYSEDYFILCREFKVFDVNGNQTPPKDIINFAEKADIYIGPDKSVDEFGFPTTDKNCAFAAAPAGTHINITKEFPKMSKNYYLNYPSPTPSPMISSIPTPSQIDTSNWKTYTDTVENLSFKYPPTWILSSQNNAVIITSPVDSQSNLQFRINYYVINNPPYLTLEAIANKEPLGVVFVNPLYITTLEYSPTNIDGLYVMDTVDITGEALTPNSGFSPMKGTEKVQFYATLEPPNAINNGGEPLATFNNNPYYNTVIQIFKSLKTL